MKKGHLPCFMSSRNGKTPLKGEHRREAWGSCSQVGARARTKPWPLATPAMGAGACPRASAYVQTPARARASRPTHTTTAPGIGEGPPASMHICNPGPGRGSGRSSGPAVQHTTATPARKNA